MVGFTRASKDVGIQTVIVALVSRLSGRPVEEISTLTNEELTEFILLGYWADTSQQLSITRKQMAKEASRK